LFLCRYVCNLDIVFIRYNTFYCLLHNCLCAPTYFGNFLFYQL
jgi:hypothetical protein